MDGAEVFGCPGSASGSGRGSGSGSGSGRMMNRPLPARPNGAALELFRVGVGDCISQTSTQVQYALLLPEKPIVADKLEASLVILTSTGYRNGAMC